MKFFKTLTTIVVGLFLGAGICNAASSEALKVKLTKDNVIVMNDIFDDDTVAIATQQAKDMDSRLPAKDPIFLLINSPGGSIDAGIELIQNLNSLNRPVHTITVFSASMGFQTVQGVNGKRLITSNGTLMSHRARGAFGGEFPGQLDSRYLYYLKRVKRLDARAVARTKGKQTLASYTNLIQNEYWCDGRECIEKGFADAVVNPSCDHSLSGTHETTVYRFIYEGHIIEFVEAFSNCPIITGPQGLQIYLDGMPLFDTYKTNKELAAKSNTATSTDPYSSSYSSRYNRTAFDNMSLETAFNIQKLIEEKLQNKSFFKVSKKVIEY